MKIKDLPDSIITLENVHFIYPDDGQAYFWASQWCKGVWGRKELGSSQLFPLFIDDLSETLEWEVVD